MNIYQFLTTNTPPHYGQPLNSLESAGNFCLIPFAYSINMLSMKTQDPTKISHLIQKIGAIAAIFLTFPITIIGALLKGIGYLWPHEELLATDVAITLSSPRKMQQCYDLTEILKKVFLEKNLTKMIDGEIIPRFVMIGDTTLGAVRHTGIIPWDKNCNFAILKEDEAEFLNLKNSFEKEGIEILDHRFDSCYKLRFLRKKIEEKYGEVSVADRSEINISIFDAMSDGSYTYVEALSRLRNPNEYFTAEDMRVGFKLMTFGPPEKELALPLLKEPEQYLLRRYGENFLDYDIEKNSLECAGVAIAFFKPGAHYFKIVEWKNRHAPSP